MATLSVLDLILAVTIIALFGISVVTGAWLLPQSANATTDLMTNTTVGEQRTEEEETISTTNNNISNAVLGSLFSSGENIEFNVNPINETYSVVSYLGSRIIIPPNDTVLTKVEQMPNKVNSELLTEFYQHMKDNGTSQNYQKGNMKAIIHFEERSLFLSQCLQAFYKNSTRPGAT